MINKIIISLVFLLTLQLHADTLFVSSTSWGTQPWGYDDYGVAIPMGLNIKGTNLFLVDNDSARICRMSIFDTNLIMNETYYSTNITYIGSTFYWDLPQRLDRFEDKLYVTYPDLHYYSPPYQLRVLNDDLNLLSEYVISNKPYSVAHISDTPETIAVGLPDGLLELWELTTPSNKTIIGSATFPEGDARLRNAYDMKFHNNTLYVVDNILDRIQMYSVVSNTITYEDTFCDANYEPLGISFSTSENLLLFTSQNNNDNSYLTGYTLDGRFLFEKLLPFGIDVIAEDVAIYNEGEVFVTLWGYTANRIVRFKIRTLLSPSNTVTDPLPSGNANALLDPGETCQFQLALENWCWTNITPTAHLNVEKTRDRNPYWYRAYWNTIFYSNNWLQLPTGTCYFSTFSHRTVSTQTNALPLTLVTNVIGRSMTLVYDVDVPELNTNFTVETDVTLNNPDAGYTPEQYNITVPHNTVTNLTLSITNAGTRELVCVYATNYSYISVAPMTNIIAPGAHGIATITIDTSLLSTNDAIYNRTLVFDGNAYPQLKHDYFSDSFYMSDIDKKSIPLRLVVTHNTPPVITMQKEYIAPENVNVYLALTRFTNHWYLTNKYVITVSAYDAQEAEDDLNSYYTYLPLPRTLVTQENLFAWMYSGSYNYCTKTKTHTNEYEVYFRDHGVPEYATTSRFYLIRENVNRAPWVQMSSPGVFETLDPITNCWFEAYDYDRDFLTIPDENVVLPPGAYLMPQTNENSGSSSWVLREWRWDNPVEGIYTTSFVVVDDGIPPSSNELGRQIEVLPEAGIASLLIAVLYLIRPYTKNTCEK